MADFHLESLHCATLRGHPSFLMKLFYILGDLEGYSDWVAVVEKRVVLALELTNLAEKSEVLPMRTSSK